MAEPRTGFSAETKIRATIAEPKTGFGPEIKQDIRETLREGCKALEQENASDYGEWSCRSLGVTGG